MRELYVDLFAGGDCAAKVEAWAGLADYKPEDELLREFWEGQSNNAR